MGTRDFSEALGNIPSPCSMWVGPKACTVCVVWAPASKVGSPQPGLIARSVLLWTVVV
jgi:hypothetical protein